jgi:uncharacterized membrane protein
MRSRSLTRPFLSGLAYALLLGAIGAGIVHIAILLLLPMFSERDAWSRLAAAADLYVMTAADGSDGTAPAVEAPDPFFRASACRFDLQDGPVRLKADGSVPFWSASIYDRGGQNVYNFNDHTAADGALDFVIVTPTQMIDMRKDLPPELASSVFVEADVDEGIVVVRAFAPDDSWASTLATYLRSTVCAPQ